MSFNPQRIFHSFPLSSDTVYTVGEVALAFAGLLHDGVVLNRYINHLKAIAQDVGIRFAALHDAALSGDGVGMSDVLAMQLAALKHIISDKHGYVSDDDKHEPIESADFLRVIDRACGHSAALVVLYMHIAQKQGWSIEGLKLHDRFLCRIEHAGMRIVFDPAAQCNVMEAHELRCMLKEALGDDAELMQEHSDGVNAWGMVVHMMNIIKFRYIEMGDHKAALALSEQLCAFAPHEHHLFLDMGVLYARCRDKERAVRCLETYIAHTPKGQGRYEAQTLLHELKIE